jgi:glycerol-3-phosphate dehydrogenase
VHTERLALVVDRVLADDSARRTAPDAAFAEYCRRYAQARTREDVLYRRARLGVLDAGRAASSSS